MSIDMGALANTGMWECGKGARGTLIWKTQVHL